MIRTTVTAAVMLCVSAFFVAGCGRSNSDAGQGSSAETRSDINVLNFYNWSDYIAPDTISSFEKLTGIKVNLSFYDTNETLEGRMLTGNSGFDVVVPTAPFLQRQIRGGAYLPLDKAKLPNLANLDPAIMARVALNDPGNAHGVVYMWGTYGMGYNEKMVSRVLPGVPVNSWRLIFDPVFAAKLATCGINLLDAPAGVERLVLKYLDRNPNAPTPQDLADVESVLMKIRPYIRNIDSASDTEALANGDICVALTYNGSFAQARNRANEAKNGNKLAFVIPKEGSLLWFDMLAIPRDAPHVANAHAFINFLLDPQVIAKDSNFIANANANAAASPFVDPAILSDPAIYTPPDVQQRLFVQTEDSPEQTRAITRIWQKFKTSQ
jgi:putrescine transport system substrate-binding protein